jgi:hypothetical protein
MRSHMVPTAIPYSSEHVLSAPCVPPARESDHMSIPVYLRSGGRSDVSLSRDGVP